MSIKKLICVLIFSSLLISCGGDSESPDYAFSEDNGGITLPEGFQGVVVADSIGQARHITVDSNGDIYVMLDELNNDNGIAALRDNSGDGIADEIEYFGDFTGTGIEHRNGYLYFSSDTSVMRYEMSAEELIPEGEPETIIRGFPDQGSHAAKSFTFDGSDNIYVNVGGPSNACQEESRTPGSPGMEPCPQLERQGGVWQFSAVTAGQTQEDDGHRYATGIRNAVALDWNSDIDNLYVAQHGRDQLNQLWPDYYTVEDNAEKPAEELFMVNDGDNFGWPYTYYDLQKEQKMLSPEYGGDGETPAEEGEYEDPVIAFPGHWAPNDLLFYRGEQFPSEYLNGAFIAFHGSWNRAPEPQDGYNVAFVPFDGELPSGDYEIFADGFAGADTLNSPGDAEHRPMGLAAGPDGSLYISDSVRGKIWRVVYTGN